MVASVWVSNCQRCRCPAILPVKWKAHSPVLSVGGQFGSTPGPVVVWPVGRSSEAAGVLVDRVARDARLSCDFAEEETLDPGVLHRPPKRRLAVRQLPLRRELSFATVVHRVVVTLGDGVGLQVSQPAQMGRAEAMVAQTLHDPAEFRSGSQCPVRGSDRTGPRRGLATGDDVALMPHL